MPASSKTFAKLAFMLEGYGPQDTDETEFFFVNVYPRYSEPVRQTIADWIAKLTDDATETDLNDLMHALKNMGDFRAKSAHNPYWGSNQAAEAAVDRPHTDEQRGTINSGRSASQPAVQLG